MRRFLAVMLLLPVISPAQLSVGSGNPGLAGGVLDHDAPQKLVEAWLRFHETDLCQGVDAVFASDANGMDVWCRVEDEKSYRKLEELLAPLQSCCRVALYATRPPVERKSADDMEPPPSLLENKTLRSYLGDPVARAREFRDDDLDTGPDISFFDDTLRRRLLAYSEQILEWNRKMKRYAMDLPALVGVALDSANTPKLRSQANAIGMAHSKKLKKLIGKLSSSLTHAFPRASKEVNARAETLSGSGKDLLENANQLSRATQDVAGRVHRFIHPENYTAGLEELRQPGLLQSLDDLERMDRAFQRALAQSAGK